MNTLIKAALAFAAIASFGQIASASTITFDIVSGQTLGNLSDLSLASLTPTSVGGNNVNTSYTTSSPLSLSGGTLALSGAQIVQGSAVNYYAAPWSTTITPPGQTGSAYLSVYGGGSATFTLASGTHTFGFDWGSVDTSNSVTVNLANGTSQTFTGQDLANLAAVDNISLTTQGTTNWGSNGSLYVSFTDTSSAIKSVVLGSGQNSFEVADARVSAVPLPGALPLFGSAIVGFGAFLRRRARKSV
jgi:hypothetical protein